MEGRMNRLSLMCVIGVLSCAAFAAPALAKPVKSGALDICQAIDEGTTTQAGNMTFCCATEKRGEYDDGMVIYGERYCVACVTGTDDCEWVEVTRSQPETIRNLKEALSTPPKQGTVTRN
jgi:hypothetical protein